MSLVGQVFSAPISYGNYVEGVVTSHNLTNGRVTLVDDENFQWKGWEYQLENIAGL